MSRHHCITFYTKPSYDTLPEFVRYAIYGEEVCPTTQRTHWQAYIELTKPMRLSAIKKLYDDKTLHAEPRKGTRDQARDYCKKDDKFIELGKWIKGQGHRSDLETIVEKLASGESTIHDVMFENPKTYCQYRNGLRDIAFAALERLTPKWRPVEVVFITGPTRCGKTREAMEEAEWRIQSSQLNWFDGYKGEKVICIDEYNNDFSITKLQDLTDGHKLRLSVKGGHTYAQWDKVIITSNLKLDEIHPNAKPAHRDAVMARIKKVIDYWPECDEDSCDEEVQGNTNTWTPPSFTIEKRTSPRYKFT